MFVPKKETEEHSELCRVMKNLYPKKEINLGFCPRCKEELDGMMTRTLKGVVFCYLCSFDAEDEDSVRQWVSWAKDYKKNMMPQEGSK